jgi:hypothetical protein
MILLFNLIPNDGMDLYSDIVEPVVRVVHLLMGLSTVSASRWDQTKVDELIPEALERMYRSSSLLYLRILAIVPACWGTLVLGHGVIAGGVWHDVWPWGADFSAEAMYRRSHGTHLEVGVWKSAVRGDLLLAIAWVCISNSKTTLADD